MREIGDSFPPTSFYDPPEGHELDGCTVCHDAGEHEGEAVYFSEDGCLVCEEWLDMLPDLKKET